MYDEDEKEEFFLLFVRRKKIRSVEKTTFYSSWSKRHGNVAEKGERIKHIAFWNTLLPAFLGYLPSGKSYSAKMSYVVNVVARVCHLPEN